MATKESKRQVKELMEGLELRVHRGPPIHNAEIESLKNYLRQNDFSPNSDYFNRLVHLESRLVGRAVEPPPANGKGNYGGEAAGYQMQVQSVYDHLILSTCYQGEFNGKRGRVKISHRFNQEGRIDFVELKQLRSLHPPLNGELRKLLLVNGYQSIRKDWLEAQASVLRILPQELIFLYAEIFRCDRMELFAWLVNIGHGLVSDLLKEVRARPVLHLVAEPRSVGRLPDPHGSHLSYALEETQAVGVMSSVSGPEVRQHINGDGERAGNGAPSVSDKTSGQLPLHALTRDRVALLIMEKVAALESVVEAAGPTEVLVRYLRRSVG